MPDYKLSEAELYIMRYFWARGPMRTDELSALVAAKGWKPTTLLTFLSRLVAKGMLSAQKRGKGNLYSPALTQSEYQRVEGLAFLDQVYDGSARDFLATMVDGAAISKEELAELRRWLDEQEVE